MYVARFETEDGRCLQAAAVLRCTAGAESADTERWWGEIGHRCAAAARLDGATVTRRITLDAERRLSELVVVVAPDAGEADVRQFFAGLTRLERVFGASVEVAPSRDVHDEWLANVPPWRYSPLDDVLSANGRTVGCDFRIAPSLDALFAEAALANRAMVYQMIVRGYRAAASDVRAARLNALALSEEPGAPAQIVELQERLSTGLFSAIGLIDEYLAVDTTTAAESAAALLHERFRSEHPALAAASGRPRFSRASHEEVFALSVHRHDLEPLSPVELSAAALSATERDGVTTWRPSPRFLALIAECVGADVADAEELPRAGSVGVVPSVYVGNEPFAFVSYKRQDLDRIAPIMRTLETLGVRLWYDRGIPGGTEWDEVIEERITRCRFVLLFVSPGAVASKYVRREVKFADARDTPVLSVVLEDTQLAHGMNMLLTQYQMLDVRASDFGARLEHALRGLA